MIKRLDTPPRQVMVQAQIFEINADSNTSMGFQFLDNRLIGGNTVLSQTAGFSGSPGGTSEGLFVKVLRNSGDQQLYLNALSQRSDFNLLSSPKIMALNNQAASLITGSSIGYKLQKTTTSTGGTVVADEVLFIQTGINFTFTPQITDDDNIKIDLNPVISDGALDASGVPQVNSTMAKTTVLVGNGQTFVIGGLITSRMDNVESKVPFLGDIPFLNTFFKKETLKEVKKELIILVTPYIVNSSSMQSMNKEVRDINQKHQRNQGGLFW
jgi:general secretion pathway protein D